MKCVKCGQIIPDESVFCPYCGNQLPSNEIPQKEDISKKSAQKSSKLRFITTAIALLCVISLCMNAYCFFIIHNLQSQKEIQRTEQSIYNDQISDTSNEDTKQFYRVNKQEGIYHLPDCIFAQDIPQAVLRVSQTTCEELEKEGFKPCDICIGNKNQASSEKKYDYDAVEMKNIDTDKFISAGYDKSQKLLLLKFRDSKAVHAYYDVPLNTYTNFLQSQSPDDYWDKNIRRKYTSEKIK